MNDFARRLGAGQHVAPDPCETTKRLALRLGGGQHLVADCRTSEPEIGKRYLARRLGAGQHVIVCRDCEDSTELCRIRFFVRGCGNRPLVGVAVTVTVVTPDSTTAVHHLTTNASGVVEVPRAPTGSTATVVINEEGFAPFNQDFFIQCPDAAAGYIGQVNLVPAAGFACLGCCARPFPSTIYLTFELGPTIALELVQPSPTVAYWQGCCDVDYIHIRYKTRRTYHYFPEDSPCYPRLSSLPRPPLPPDEEGCISLGNYPFIWTGTRYWYATEKFLVVSSEIRQMKMGFRVQFDWPSGRCVLLVSDAIARTGYRQPIPLRYSSIIRTRERGLEIIGQSDGVRGLADIEFDLDACEEVSSIPPGLPPEGTCHVLFECVLSSSPPPPYIDLCAAATAAFDLPLLAGQVVPVFLEPRCQDSPALYGKWRYAINEWIGLDAQCCRRIYGTNDFLARRFPTWLCEDQSFVITP